MEKKEIKIDPSLFNVGGGGKTRKGKLMNSTSKKTKDMLVNVNGKSVKELLLEKLKQYKKAKTAKKPQINTNPVPNQRQLSPDFMEKLRKRKQKTENNVFVSDNNHFNSPSQSANHYPKRTLSFHNNENNNMISQNNRMFPDQNIIQPIVDNFQPYVAPYQQSVQHTPQQILPQHAYNNRFLPKHNQSEPKYGILKNGRKPTLRSLKYYDPNYQNVREEQEHKPRTKRERIQYEIERKLKVGRNRKTRKVGIFIRNRESRNKIENRKLDMKKENIRTVKKYLKKNCIIKHGSDAPTEILRYMFETSKLLGDVENKNGKSRIHNFFNDDDEDDDNGSNSE